VVDDALEEVERAPADDHVANHGARRWKRSGPPPEYEHAGERSHVQAAVRIRAYRMAAHVQGLRRESVYFRPLGSGSPFVLYAGGT
jgi:hypothetical protein